ncbi:uncharacterized protein MONOS_12106 [Monocercomonoides exilis]|uniref:uncharacterized protein n=1 Tax=Monocercomonoides exilis TaxID=2049356 RepID=UPI003559B119|nr:hypothetical protein MONOS_12106 [Monocercomonoides exilis]|eukprot:MONOS_12106.1-p1 / transcript=MONOS_12106.1 / gene=MONOS_12106 / organism=Monocercomonoides_exilis_PA203 / gene_product=unspecified product / transcript_product=unspecified product / location=Mono_scaffold00646:12301-13837(-) / protein_length=460 / sequence_SO=supercontig / SO=protein_coding / is_pseudo=false
MAVSASEESLKETASMVQELIGMTQILIEVLRPKLAKRIKEPKKGLGKLFRGSPLKDTVPSVPLFDQWTYQNKAVHSACLQQEDRDFVSADLVLDWLKFVSKILAPIDENEEKDIKEQSEQMQIGQELNDEEKVEMNGDDHVPFLKPNPPRLSVSSTDEASFDISTPPLEITQTSNINSSGATSSTSFSSKQSNSNQNLTPTSNYPSQKQNEDDVPPPPPLDEEITENKSAEDEPDNFAAQSNKCAIHPPSYCEDEDAEDGDIPPPPPPDDDFVPQPPPTDGEFDESPPSSNKNENENDNNDVDDDDEDDVPPPPPPADAAPKPPKVLARLSFPVIPNGPKTPSPKQSTPTPPPPVCSSLMKPPSASPPPVPQGHAKPASHSLLSPSLFKPLNAPKRIAFGQNAVHAQSASPSSFSSSSSSSSSASTSSSSSSSSFASSFNPKVAHGVSAANSYGRSTG